VRIRRAGNRRGLPDRFLDQRDRLAPSAGQTIRVAQARRDVVGPPLETTALGNLQGVLQGWDGFSQVALYGVDIAEAGVAYQYAVSLTILIGDADRFLCMRKR